jgi:hypothetical protein
VSSWWLDKLTTNGRTILDQILGLLVGQVTLIVEAFRRIDHHCWLRKEGNAEVVVIA